MSVMFYSSAGLFLELCLRILYDARERVFFFFLTNFNWRLKFWAETLQTNFYTHDAYGTHF